MQIFFAFPNLDKSELKKILLSLIPRKARKVAPKCATITQLDKIFLCFGIFRIIFWGKGGKIQIFFAFPNIDKSELKKCFFH